MKFKLGFYNWLVKFVDYEIVSDGGDSALGITFLDDKIIKISNNQNQQCKRETLMHELLHACFGDFDLDDELEEKIILHISPILMDLLDNNPEVRNYLVNENLGEKQYD